MREAAPLCGNIWLCDNVTTPFILGTVRPRIYLPSGVDAVRMVSVRPLAFGEVGVKQRIKAVLKYKAPAFRLTLIAMAVFALVTSCFLTV